MAITHEMYANSTLLPETYFDISMTKKEKGDYCTSIVTMSEEDLYKELVEQLYSGMFGPKGYKPHIEMAEICRIEFKRRGRGFLYSSALTEAKLMIGI